MGGREGGSSKPPEPPLDPPLTIIKVLLVAKFLTLFNLMDYPIYIDAVSMEWFILYFKGLQVKICIK